MTGWMERLQLRGKNKSATSAKERLKLVLIHDRTDLTPHQMDSLKNEIIGLISRYIEIDSEMINITITQDGRAQRLVADIPLKAKSRQRSG